MRPNIFIKLLVYFTFVFIVVILIVFVNKGLENGKKQNIKVAVYNKSLKYILQWTKPNTIPFVYMGVGQMGFLSRNCTYTNCYITSDRNLLDDYTNFSVIAFHGPEVITLKRKELPSKRSPKQKYVFASIESSDYYPVCDNMFDEYFNWTWTYKLNSDEPFGYISVRDSKFDVIGPKTDMQWLSLEDMNDVDDDLKTKLKSKTKAAAWIVSNCEARSKRQDFVRKLQVELKKYGLGVDIYGGCGPLKCHTDDMSQCLKFIEKDYYFYLSFENSFSEDYVTEKLLHGLQHNTVPIVYGGANYTRFMPDGIGIYSNARELGPEKLAGLYQGAVKKFMPDGIYLNARELGPEKLAETMNSIINDEEKYYQCFKWKNHYSYHDRSESVDTNDYCRFCAMVNDEQLMGEVTVYHDFKEWWTPPGRCHNNISFFIFHSITLFICIFLFVSYIVYIFYTFYYK